MIRRTSFALGSLLLLSGILVACATPAGSGGATAEPRGDTPSATPSPSEEAEIDAAWLDGGRVIGLVTSGSSTCVPSATDAVLDGDVVTVTLVDPDFDKPCTRDYVPRVTLVQAPEGVDPAKGVTIAVSGSVVGETELGGVEGLAPGGETDYLPSAGWAGTGGQLVILTWGSSGCVPQVKDAAATGPAEVTVSFVDPPADQVCTADMAPRGTLVAVDGIEPGAAVEVVLTGGGFDDVRVPVLGTA